MIPDLGTPILRAAAAKHRQHEWDLRDEIASIIVIERDFHDRSSYETAGKILELLARCAAVEPLQTTDESRDDAAV